MNAAAVRRPLAQALLPPRARRMLKSLLCVAWHGKHELYRAHDDTRVYQQCLRCGHETPGWTIDRRDRRPR